MRRHGHQLRPLEREDAVQLRKADVVANGQAELPVLELSDDRLVSGFLRLGLAVDDAPDLDVEEMDLAIRRDDLSLGIEDKRRIRKLAAAFAPLGDRAAAERAPLRAAP